MVVSWVVGPFWENLVYRTLQCARWNKGIIGWRSTKFPSGIACDAFRTVHPMRLRRMFGVTVCRHDFLQLTTKMYMRPCDFLILSLKSHHTSPRTTHLGTISVGWGWVYADTEAYPEMRQTPTVVSTVPCTMCFVWRVVGSVFGCWARAWSPQLLGSSVGSGREYIGSVHLATGGAVGSSGPFPGGGSTDVTRCRDWLARLGFKFILVLGWCLGWGWPYVCR